MIIRLPQKMAKIAWDKTRRQSTASRAIVVSMKPKLTLKDVRAKNFYNTDFFHTLATVI